MRRFCHPGGVGVLIAALAGLAFPVMSAAPPATVLLIRGGTLLTVVLAVLRGANSGTGEGTNDEARVPA